MKLKHMVLVFVAALALMTHLAGGATPTVYAAGGVPTVTLDELQTSPWVGVVNGAGFTPGGAVHLTLVFSAVFSGPGIPPQGDFIAGSFDTTAARTTKVSNGHGVWFTRDGGYFTFYPSVPANSAPCPSMGVDYDMFVVATDVATGRTNTSNVYPGECW